MSEPQDMIAAIKAGDIASVRAMLASNPGLVNAQTESGLSLVLLATYYGQVDIARVFIQHGASLDLFQACTVGELNRVTTLLAQQPTLVNAFARDGFTPLGLAAFFGHFALVEFLLAHGANPNLASNNSQHVAPLNSAAAGRHLDIARVLIAHGADVNARQTGGFAPLHNAAQNGQLAMIELLIANGADINARADDGKTPRVFALEAKHVDAARILQERGGA